MRVYVIRHGESETNYNKQWTGWSDVHLTDKGKEDAKKARDFLKHIPFDKIFASDLIRAVETAKIVLPDYSYETSLNMGVVRMVKERLSISSTELFYGLVCKLLENLK